MLKDLREQVLEANLELNRQKLVIFSWGNASGLDRESGLMVIKPSGVPYAKLTTRSMVVVDPAGRVVEGKLRPSSDTPTHLELYRSFPEIGGVAHTHSPWATAWAQAGRGIPCYGTTHADYFYGEVPCTRPLTPGEIENDYELNTGRVIIERFSHLNCLEIPGVLAAMHAPFTWGRDALQAVEAAVVLEEVAKTAFLTERLNNKAGEIPRVLLDRHFLRKHGKQAYYGQNSL